MIPHRTFPNTGPISGEIHDCKVAPEFVAKLLAAYYTIADKGYDSEELKEMIRKKPSMSIISRKSNSTLGNSDR
jgi:hypothetical protein